MDITKKNFDPTAFQKAIDGAQFMAFDAEFSGLSIGNEDYKLQYDSDDELYRKMKMVCDKCFAFQFGISLFRWDPSSNSYEVMPFNFYVFPSSKLPHHDSPVSFQIGTVHFLNQHNYDWNKTFREGIPYR